MAMYKLCYEHVAIAGVASVSTLHASVHPCGGGGGLPPSHTEVMHVSLTSGAGGPAGPGIALHVADGGGGSGSWPPVIGYIEKGSPAEKCGALQPGDRVLAINEWSTLNAQSAGGGGGGTTAHEANRFLRAAALAGPVTLTVEFDVLEPPAAGSSSSPQQATCTSVKLRRKSVSQSLGIVLAASHGELPSSGEGHATAAYKGRPVVVADVRTGSVAHRSGVIRPGDLIVAIDRIPLSACTIDEAARLLQRAGELVHIAIIRDPPACSDASASASLQRRQQQQWAAQSDGCSQATVIVYSVELSRRGGPLGVTIASTDEPGAPIVVSALAHGGLAARAKALRVGDRLLAINGQSVGGRRVSEAMDLMRAASDTVQLKLCRCIEPMSAAGSQHEHHRHSDQSGGDTSQHQQHDERSSSAGGVKSGTPVQSIDSAVESLEESPCAPHLANAAGGGGEQLQQQAQLVAHGRMAGPQDRAKYVEELSAQLQRLNTGHQHTPVSCTSAGDYAHGGQQPQASCSRQQRDTPLHIQTGGGSGHAQHNQASGGSNMNYATDSGLGSAEKPAGGRPRTDDHNQQAKEEWMRVLEALETVGEAEMLRKLEQSILEGSVPNPGSGGASAGTCGTGVGGRQAPPFPVTNTILRHPYTSAAPGAMARTDVRASTASLSDQGSVGSERGRHGVPVPPPKPPYPQPLSPPTADQADSLRLMGAGGCSTAQPPVADNSNAPAATGNGASPHLELRKLDRPALFAKLARHAATEFDRRQYGEPSTSGDVQVHSVDAPADARSTQQQAVAAHEPPPPRPPQQYQQQRRQQPQPAKRPSAGGGREFRVTLHKDRDYNDFGFSVSDVDNEPGVFVNKIRPGGPAHRCGLLRPCDRILQVNNTSVAQLDCILAVPVLLAAADRLELLLRREEENGTTGGKLSNGSVAFRDDGVILEEENENDDEPAGCMMTMKDSAV